MRASARASSTVARHVLERRDQEERAEIGTLAVLEELATTLERTLARVNELHERERTAAAA